MYSRKVNVLCPSKWSHHRGGWSSCVSAMKSSLHIDQGVSFYTNTIISVLNENPILKPWIAVFHVTRFDRLEDVCKQDNWKQSLPWCRGAYVLCEDTVDYVQSSLNIKTEPLVYPCDPCDLKFDMDSYVNNKKKRVIHVGHWLRRPEKVGELDTELTKTILCCDDKQYCVKNVEIFDYVSQDKYDQLLSENVVFLNLKDASANTSILECIVRNTPVLVNRLPAVEEYLGKDYPLFYETIEEASCKLSDELIYESHKYLKEMNKDRFSLDYFIRSIVESEIYGSLPKPFLF